MPLSFGAPLVHGLPSARAVLASARVASTAAKVPILAAVTSSGAVAYYHMLPPAAALAPT